MALSVSMQAAKATEAASTVKAEKFFLKAVDMSWKLWYNKDVERGWRNEWILLEDRAL